MRVGSFTLPRCDGKSVTARAPRPRGTGLAAVTKLPFSTLVGRFGILGRLLPIRHDRGIGYRWHRVIDVLKSIRESPSLPRSEFTLYFIAARVYAPAMSEREAEWLRAWSDDIKSRIRAGDKRYLRDPSYDALLSVLFPEMAQRLASPGATRRR